jgi:UDP-glucose 4-epimerase
LDRILFAAAGRHEGLGDGWRRYIGSDGCKALAARGFEPVTYDNLARGNRWAVKWGPLQIEGRKAA